MQSMLAHRTMSLHVGLNLRVDTVVSVCGCRPQVIAVLRHHRRRRPRARGTGADPHGTHTTEDQ
eukprot:8004-Eustigmatos_ZCMA.PRE.1